MNSEPAPGRSASGRAECESGQFRKLFPRPTLARRSLTLTTGDCACVASREPLGWASERERERDAGKPIGMLEKTDAMESDTRAPGVYIGIYIPRDREDGEQSKCNPFVNVSASRIFARYPSVGSYWSSSVIITTCTALSSLPETNASSRKRQSIIIRYVYREREALMCLT